MMVAADRLEGRALFEHPASAAMMAVIRERGFELAGVEELIARSGMERGEFERQFSGKADAVLRIFEAFIDDFQARVAAAFASEDRWPTNLRAAAYEVARWMREYPDYTWFGLVGVLEAQELGRVRREEVFRWAGGLIDQGRAVAPDPDSVPRSAPLIAVGAIAETSRRRQEGPVGADPVAGVPELMYGAVRPYLGEEAARAELEIPPPPDLAGDD
jgi:AcrR family transcriptional regulator